MMRRRGPGLVRVAATTAVVAGTAGAVSHHQQQKYANQNAEAQAQQDAVYQQGVADAQAQQAAAAPAPAAAPAVDPTTAELQNLANLHTQGILSDEEFAAAKAKVLGI
jgi:Short C-terminal domain